MDPIIVDLGMRIICVPIEQCPCACGCDDPEGPCDCPEMVEICICGVCETVGEVADPECDRHYVDAEFPDPPCCEFLCADPGVRYLIVSVCCTDGGGTGPRGVSVGVVLSCFAGGDHAIQAVGEFVKQWPCNEMCVEETIDLIRLDPMNPGVECTVTVSICEA